MTSRGRLEGQVGIVTGGGRGLGAELAKALSREGMRLALAGRSRPSLEKVAAELETQALAIPTDVTLSWAVRKLVERAEAELGPVDLLINNAGITEHGPIWETTPEDWWQVLEVNLKGPYLCSRAVLEYMVPRGHGRIVNVSSYVGNAPNADQTAYAVSKAALTRLTDSLAAQTEQHGVQVFAISPGLLETDMGVALQRRRGQLETTEWVPKGLSGNLVLRIAAGELDPLSGLMIHATDEVGDMLRRIDEIDGQQLYQLRFQKLRPPETHGQS